MKNYQLRNEGSCMDFKKQNITMEHLDKLVQSSDHYVELEAELEDLGIEFHRIEAEMTMYYIVFTKKGPLIFFYYSSEFGGFEPSDVETFSSLQHHTLTYMAETKEKELKVIKKALETQRLRKLIKEPNKKQEKK